MTRQLIPAFTEEGLLYQQVRRAQELRNQQAMLAMQAQALQVQQDMANAEWANANASQRQADELARIRSKLE